jgi:flagellar motor switch protein FliN/FliY
MTETPLYWIKEIQNTLIDARVIPLSGFIPDFPWEALGEKMASLLQIPGLKIIPRKTQFLQESELLGGMGASPLPVTLELTPLSIPAFWVMGREDIAKFAHLALLPSNSSKGFSTPQFQEGFYYYLTTLAAGIIDELRAWDTLEIKIGKPAVLPKEESLCIDVEIQHPKQTLWGRLICPSSLHLALKTHFSRETAPTLSSSFAKQLEVTLRLELGTTSLDLSEWEKVRVGDCILLDRCTYDPKTRKGTAQVVLEDEKENPETEEFSPSEFEEEAKEEQNHLWSAQNTDVEKMISAKEIPLMLTVEVARLRISLDKLLQLSPGNVLELPVKPEQGVDILANGKKIAKAELVKLGEALAVKILQIGDHG